MPETDRQTIMPDRPLAPLLTMTQEEYDGLRELAQRYEEAGVSIAEIDAQRAARATAEALWREVGQHIDVAAIGWNHQQIAAVFAENLRLRRARATAYAEGYWDVIDQIKAHCIDGAELDECVMSIVGSRRNRDD